MTDKTWNERDLNTDDIHDVEIISPKTFKPIAGTYELRATIQLPPSRIEIRGLPMTDKTEIEYKKALEFQHKYNKPDLYVYLVLTAILNDDDNPMFSGAGKFYETYHKAIIETTEYIEKQWQDINMRFDLENEVVVWICDGLKIVGENEVKMRVQIERMSIVQALNLLRNNIQIGIHRLGDDNG